MHAQSTLALSIAVLASTVSGALIPSRWIAQPASGESTVSESTDISAAEPKLDDAKIETPTAKTAPGYASTHTTNPNKLRAEPRAAESVASGSNARSSDIEARGRMRSRRTVDSSV